MFTIILLLFLLIKLEASNEGGFTYNGFLSAKLSLDGIAGITPNGLLELTNITQQRKGHAFPSMPLQFKDPTNGTVYSFSTTFVFAIFAPYPDFCHGMAFVITPERELPGALPAIYIGLFNSSNNGNSTNHVLALELDTVQNLEFEDVDDNHVGIDINSLNSTNSAPAAYYSKENGGIKNLSLLSGEPMQVWVEYNGRHKKLDVTIAPVKKPKPNRPLLSSRVNLSSVLLENMYVGFSSATGVVITSNYVLGWSFRMNGNAQDLDLSRLPKLPRRGPKRKSKMLVVGLPTILLGFIFVILTSVLLFVRRKIRFAEILEDWEREYGPQRFSYKDLFIATKGFRYTELVGIGGFGRVYKGVLPSSKVEVAVKRVSHESRQGMREFIAEIISIGRLRHRNLVWLIGYCRCKGELLLVYDFMPNGSLDKLLFDQPISVLTWNQRFRIIKGVASGLYYLHDEWEQIVIHRDIKASNVLLDDEFNGRLGDFGLSRLYDHGTDPQTTHVVGTLGYMAPELSRTGKATTSTDVYSFGAFILEVACGRRPIYPRASAEEVVLVDWVSECWRRGTILETSDPNLGSGYVVGEMELMLKLGLLCSHPVLAYRPCMRQVMQFLDGDVPLPELSASSFSVTFPRLGHNEGVDDFIVSNPSSLDKSGGYSSSIGESILFGGR
ncbi:L-type lectin-domain containing receptor kinase IV.1-like isoform X1 [Tasmannia lanceolata]|uniref:L-type lectin-domain containing receptor kinase IV.1-like isoform X1 n=1 Tax=Tasmannia lanceolata TaxID=3420 RepID=UPI0040649EA8